MVESPCLPLPVPRGTSPPRWHSLALASHLPFFCVHPAMPPGPSRWLAVPGEAADMQFLGR